MSPEYLQAMTDRALLNNPTGKFDPGCTCAPCARLVLIAEVERLQAHVARDVIRKYKAQMSKKGTKFSSAKIVAEINKLGDVTVSVGGPGGDWDTVEIHVKPKGKGHDGLFIAGFVENGSPEINPKDDVNVDMVYVKDGLDSDGGLNSGDEATCILYGRVVHLLRKMGFSVVRSMDAYF